MIHASDCGKYRVSLDGKELATVDLYADKPQRKAHDWGWHVLTPGEHVLRFECMGKSANSRGHALGLDALVARTAAYSRPADFDLRKIQVQK
ncbi:MAG: hypothetical protein AAB676_15235 [Verrucomicrobiota bacterium]